MWKRIGLNKTARFSKVQMILRQKPKAQISQIDPLILLEYLNFDVSSEAVPMNFCCLYLVKSVQIDRKVFGDGSFMIVISLLIACYNPDNLNHISV